MGTTGTREPIRPVVLIVDAGGEQDRLGRARGPVAEDQRPQVVLVEEPALAVAQRAREAPGARAVGVDEPVAEVAHEQVVVERAEVRRGTAAGGRAGAGLISPGCSLAPAPGSTCPGQLPGRKPAVVPNLRR
jgi:hypothetical protein